MCEVGEGWKEARGRAWLRPGVTGYTRLVIVLLGSGWVHVLSETRDLTPCLQVLMNSYHTCWLKKKSTMWELWIELYLGQNEDYSTGESTSDSSEKKFQRDGARSVYMWFQWSGSTCNEEHTRACTHTHTHTHTHMHIYILQKVSASHKEQSLWRIWMLL